MSVLPPGWRQHRALAQLAARHRRAGYRAAAAEDEVTAIHEYRAALDLVRELAAIEPADHDVLRQLAARHHKEGKWAAVMGHSVAVRSEFQAELILLERLSQDLPDDLELLRSRAAAHAELARRAQFDGDDAACQRENAAQVAILQQAALADPETRDLLREASAEPEQSGTALAQGDAGPPATGPPVTEPGAAEPDTAERIAHLKELVDRARAAEDGVTARAGLRALILLRRRIVTARPGDAGALQDLADAHRALGDCYAGTGQDDVAYESSQAEVAVLVLLAAVDPSNVDPLNALAGAYALLADRARRAGYPVPARAAAQAEVLIRSWLVTFHPVSWRQQSLDEAQRRLASLPGTDPPPGSLLSR